MLHEERLAASSQLGAAQLHLEISSSPALRHNSTACPSSWGCVMQLGTLGDLSTHVRAVDLHDITRLTVLVRSSDQPRRPPGIKVAVFWGGCCSLASTTKLASDGNTMRARGALCRSRRPSSVPEYSIGIVWMWASAWPVLALVVAARTVQQHRPSIMTHHCVRPLTTCSQGIIQGGYGWIKYPPGIHCYPPPIHLGISTFTGDQLGMNPGRSPEIRRHPPRKNPGVSPAAYCLLPTENVFV